MYLDAVNAVKTGNYPSSWQDVYNGDNCLIVKSGNWINYGPIPGSPLQGGPGAIQGNFNNDEEISQGVGDIATLTADNATGFEIKGTYGPNRGKMQVFVDDVSQGTITLTNPNWAQNQSLFKSAVLTKGTHTLKIVNASTDVSVSQVGIDEIIVTKQR